MTHDTDVLVLGAGPAGSSAAHACARAGLSVTLVDRAEFPRDKVCGDALIPDALGALRALGLHDAVSRRALTVHELRLFPPRGPAVPLAGRFQCLPRRELDVLLLEAATAAGARFHSRVQVRSPIEEGGSIRGAVMVGADGREVAIRARWTLLATGADAAMLSAFGLGTLERTNAVALRAYFRVEPELARELRYLAIAYDASICPGYGWVFPGPDGVFNVGVGWFGDRVPGRTAGLRSMWDRFVTSFPLARRVVGESRQLTAARGAPLRTGLHGARPARAGLLAIGEAAGFTYAATGEGIGKAMESGILAADLIGEAAASGLRPARLGERYAEEITRRYAGRFAAYDVAQRWSSQPRLLNLLARRANAGTFVRRELEALVAETGDPRTLFSAPGLLRALMS